MHVPVLLQEVIKYLEPKPGKKFIDATLGGGGHARAIIEHGGQVLGIDRDPKVAKNAKIKTAAGDFKNLKSIAEENGFEKVDGVLFDLGLGSHQLDDAERGFSFQKSGPLDMRYNPEQALTAQKLVNEFPEKELVKIFYRFGEERRFGKRIARAILEARKAGRIETTFELFELIKKTLPSKLRFKAGDTARRIFMSLRIAVNDELASIEQALPQALDILAGHGRLVVISFHSLEDRLVKSFMVEAAKDCICPPSFPVCRCDKQAALRILTKKPVQASQEEIAQNPRSRSAKLRAAEKL